MNKEVILVKKVGSQGEVTFIKQPEMTEIPKGFSLAKTNKGVHIVAHSETGHHHVVHGSSAAVMYAPETPERSYLDELLGEASNQYQKHGALAVVEKYTDGSVDEMEFYLHVTGGIAEVVHLRDNDTHKSLGLTPGFWKGVKQVEYTPEGYRQVRD